MYVVFHCMFFCWVQLQMEDHKLKMYALCRFDMHLKLDAFPHAIIFWCLDRSVEHLSWWNFVIRFERLKASLAPDEVGPNPNWGSSTCGTMKRGRSLRWRGGSRYWKHLNGKNTPRCCLLKPDKERKEDAFPGHPHSHWDTFFDSTDLQKSNLKRDRRQRRAVCR